jgi:uncharacterized GH25 family protein
MVRIVVALAIAATVATVATVDAHDFWLVPNAFAIAATAGIQASGRFGARFPISESAVTAASIASARIVGATDVTRITGLTVEGKILRIRQKPVKPGQYLVAVRLKPRTTRATEAGFLRYLSAEGAATDAARIGREPPFALADRVTFRSTSYATTIVDVGAGPRVYAKGTGDAVEFIPVSDPATVSVGDTLRFRVLSAGHPNPGLEVHAGPAEGRPRKEAESSAAATDLHLLSDTNGIVEVPITAPGLWNVRTVRVFLASPQGRDGPSEWEVTRVTYVFSVRVRTR